MGKYGKGISQYVHMEKDQVNALVSEYAKKISRGDTVSAEKKLRRIARRIDKETEETEKEKKGGNAK